MRYERLRMHGWVWLAAVVLTACSGDTVDEHKSQELDVAAFHELLSRAETAAQIEKVHVELRGRDDAQYVVTLKNTSVRRIVHAAFPGTLAEELYRAAIPYSARPSNATRLADEREVDATAFRSLLGEQDEAATISHIRIEPFGQTAAKYLVMSKRNSLVRVVYAEFPGAIVAAIQAAGIPCAVKSE